jgi:uncharacterized DUF497 family protein
LAAEIEFDWDDHNRSHLARHHVSPVEFEQVLLNDPLDMAFLLVDGEERYRSVGVTNGGRVLTVVWAIREGKIRAVTAFPAGAADKKAFLGRRS